MLMARNDNFVIYFACAMMVFLLKLYYSEASADDVRWILSPTTKLVSLFTSVKFNYDATKGFVAEQLPIAIGVGCAGINFLVITLVMSVYCIIPQSKSSKWAILLVLGIAAYLFTLLVNSSRIITEIIILESSSESHNKVLLLSHGVQGGIFFFTFLVFYYIGLRALARKWSLREII